MTCKYGQFRNASANEAKDTWSWEKKKKKERKISRKREETTLTVLEYLILCPYTFVRVSKKKKKERKGRKKGEKGKHEK